LIEEVVDADYKLEVGKVGADQVSRAVEGVHGTLSLPDVDHNLVPNSIPSSVVVYHVKFLADRDTGQEEAGDDRETHGKREEVEQEVEEHISLVLAARPQAVVEEAVRILQARVSDLVDTFPLQDRLVAYLLYNLADITLSLAGAQTALVVSQKVECSVQLRMVNWLREDLMSDRPDHVKGSVRTSVIR
jgi:hypothetical protein